MLPFHFICSSRTYIHSFSAPAHSLCARILHWKHCRRVYPLVSSEQITSQKMQVTLLSSRWSFQVAVTTTKLVFTMCFLGSEAWFLVAFFFSPILVCPFLDLVFFLLLFLRLPHHSQILESVSSWFCLILNYTRTESSPSC